MMQTATKQKNNDSGSLRVNELFEIFRLARNRGTDSLEVGLYCLTWIECLPS